MTTKTILSGHLSYVYTSHFVSLKLKSPPQGTWILCTVLSPPCPLPPWSASASPAPQLPGAPALPNFPLPTVAPFQTFADGQDLKESSYCTCTLSEKEPGGYTPPKQTKTRRKKIQKSGSNRPTRERRKGSQQARRPRAPLVASAHCSGPQRCGGDGSSKRNEVLDSRCACLTSLRWVLQLCGRVWGKLGVNSHTHTHTHTHL